MENVKKYGINLREQKPGIGRGELDNGGCCFDGCLHQAPGGGCICPCCGARLSRQDETPCYKRECPQCGITMIRNWYD